MKLFSKGRSVRRRAILWAAFVVLFLGGLFAASFSYYLYNEVKNRFSSRRWSVPARVHSSTVPVYAGQHISLSQLRRVFE